MSASPTAPIIVRLTEDQAAEAEREGHANARRPGDLFKPPKGDRTAFFINAAGANIAFREWLQEARDRAEVFVRTSPNPNASLTVREGDKNTDTAWLLTGTTKSREFVVVGWLPVREAKRHYWLRKDWRPTTWLVPQTSLRPPGDFGAALFDLGET